MLRLRALNRAVGSLLAIGVLAVATFAATAAPAQATVPCPQGPISGTLVSSWTTEYSDRGISLCRAWFRGGSTQFPLLTLQIVDIDNRAFLGFGADPGTVASNPADNLFHRHTMSDWAQRGGMGGPLSSPVNGAYGLFGVTNGAFFTSTSTPDTKLSMPYKQRNEQLTGPNSDGLAIYGVDPAWNVPKRVLSYNYQDRFYRDLKISAFPTNYTAFDAKCYAHANCLVGFHPLADGGDPNALANRTLVGTDTPLGAAAAHRAYIMTTNRMKVAQADDILKAVGAQATMQLDGGGSTYMKTNVLDWDPNWPLNRAVPQVLTTWYGPPGS